MKRRQVSVALRKSSNAVACMAKAASAALGLALMTAALLPGSVEAAIDPAERVPTSLSTAGVVMAQAPPAPGAGPGAGVDAVVPPVKRVAPDAAGQEPPPPAAEPAPAAQVQQPAIKPDEPAPQANAKSPPPPPESGGVLGAIQEWLARSNRDYQGVVIKELSLPPGGRTADDAIAKKLEETKAEDARRAALDAAKKSAGAKQRDDDKRRAAEKATEAKRLAEEGQRKKAEPAAKSDDAARIAEELRRTEQQQQDEAKRVEAQKKTDEARRLEDERKKAEARIAEARATEERRRTEEAERAKYRSRTIVLSVEPIRRPQAVGKVYRPELASPRARVRLAEGSSEAGTADDGSPHRRVALYRTASAHRGTAVRRWVWRERGRACRHSGRRITPPARYTVRRGDSLWRISERHYNAGRLYPKIFRANRKIIRDPDLIYPCQRVRVPRRHHS